MRTITTRFAMLVATAAVAPLLVSGIVSLNMLRTGTRQSAVEVAVRVAAEASDHIQEYVNGNVKLLQLLATDLRILELPADDQREILADSVLDFPEFRELTLFDSGGRAIASSRLGPPRTSVPPAADAQPVVITPIEIDNDLLPKASLAVQIARFDRPVAWLVGELSLEALWRLVDEIRIGQRGFTLLVDRHGTLIAHGNPDEKARVALGEHLRDHPLVRRLMADPATPDSWTEYASDAGVMQLAAAAPLPDLGWTVVVEQPAEEAYALTTRFERQLLMAIGLALIGTIALGALWGRSFLQPIFTLIRGTQALAAGQLDERVRINRDDEFQRLGEAFNTMADRLVSLQQDAVRQERHAMLGRVAAGLAHDLAHPIQNIGNSCKLILRISEDPDYRETFKRTVDREFTVIRRVLDDLRNVARPLPLERFAFDANRTMADTAAALANEAEAKAVELALDLAADPLTIESDPIALGRVIRNLATNAVQATPGGGTVTLRTRSAGDVVRLEVEDTGCGIARDRLDVVFDDFVTTKRRGLGLGLAIAKRITEQLGGRIGVESVEGRGSTFAVEFPAATTSAPEAAAAG